MRNLLREQDKKIIRREYVLRVVSVSLILFFFTVLVGAVFLLPSYFLSHSSEKTIREHAETVKRLIELRGKDISAVLLSETKEELQLLSAGHDRVSLESILRAIIENKPRGIKLYGLFVERDSGGKSDIVVIGIASGREELLSFKKRLDREVLFESVMLPISNLASDQDIEFSINITGAL